MNFFIYCGIGQQFRSTLRSPLRYRSPPPDVGASTHVVSVAVGMATDGSTPGGGSGGAGGVTAIRVAHGRRQWSRDKCNLTGEYDASENDFDENTVV